MDRKVKLSEHINQLNKIIKEHPEALDMDVIICSNDENKYYFPSSMTPEIGSFRNGEFLSEKLFSQFGEKERNAICLN